MYRNNLPQLSNQDIFLTDGGAETYLIFKKEFQIEHFSAFPVIKDEQGRKLIEEYYNSFSKVAMDYNRGFLVDSITWRASRDWAEKQNISLQELSSMIIECVQLLVETKKKIQESSSIPVVISGCLGPRGDGYQVGDQKMTAEESEAYHSEQISTFANKTEVDLVTAYTLNYPEEAIGIVKAAKNLSIPVVISFTVETNGKLPCGISLKEAIEVVDEATENYASYFLINCSHPKHFWDSFEADCEANEWHKRIKGMRSNASILSHEELESLETVDEGDIEEFGHLSADLRRRHSSHLNILGGCCGTNSEHVKSIAQHLKNVSQD